MLFNQPFLAPVVGRVQRRDRDQMVVRPAGPHRFGIAFRGGMEQAPGGQGEAPVHALRPHRLDQRFRAAVRVLRGVGPEQRIDVCDFHSVCVTLTSYAPLPPD